MIYKYQKDHWSEELMQKHIIIIVPKIVLFPITFDYGLVCTLICLWSHSFLV